MFFSVQGFMGLETHQTIPGSQGEISVEKKNESLVQERTPDPKTFFNFLARAAQERKFQSQSGNGKIGSPLREEQTRKEPLNFVGSEFDPEKRDHQLEIPTEANMLLLSESLFNLIRSADSSTVDAMISEFPEESIYACQESPIKSIMLQALNFITENAGLNVNENELLFSFNQLNDLLVDLHEQRISGFAKEFFSGSLSGKVHAASKDFSDAALMANLYKGIKEEGSTAQTKKWKEIADVTDNMFNPLNNGQILSHLEILSRDNFMVKAHEGQPVTNPQIDENRAEAYLRNLLNSLTANSQHKSYADTDTYAAGLKAYPATDETMSIIKEYAKNILVQNVDGNLQGPRDRGQLLSNSFFQYQQVPDVNNHNSSLNVQVRQSAMPFVNDFQGIENIIVSQVVNRLYTGFRQGSGNWMMCLHPPELGKVKVRIVSGKGSLNIHLQSQNHHVAGVLEKHLSTLKHSLEDQGIVLSDLQVSVESGAQESSQFKEQEFYFSDPKMPMTEPSGNDMDTLISERKFRWLGLPQGLSLRV